MNLWELLNIAQEDIRSAGTELIEESTLQQEWPALKERIRIAAANWKEKENSSMKKEVRESPPIRVGRHYWFEYHCEESFKSADAKLWLHSHQRVKILRRLSSAEADIGEIGYMFHVRFADGWDYDVFEDELFDNPQQFYRPDPPRGIPLVTSQSF